MVPFSSPEKGCPVPTSKTSFKRRRLYKKGREEESRANLNGQFTVNMLHHCRVCGQIFCGNCSANSIPAPFGEPKTGSEEERVERIRVCNYCFKQWEHGIVANGNNPIQSSTPVLSASSSDINRKYGNLIKQGSEVHYCCFPLAWSDANNSLRHLL